MSIPATKLKERFGDSRKRRPNKLETKPSRFHRTLTEWHYHGVANRSDKEKKEEGDGLYSRHFASPFVIGRHNLVGGDCLRNEMI